MADLVVRIIEHGSAEYAEAVALRNRVLRQPLGLRFTPEELAAERDNAHVAAFADGTIVGTLLLQKDSGVEWRMRQVAVEPTRQGCGIGRRMVEFAEALARKSAVSRIVLHARDNAIPFYVRLEYRTVGEPFEDVTLRHLKMQKFLKPLG